MGTENLILYAALAGGVVLLGVIAFFFAPAHTNIIVDTSGSTARADLKTMWGMGPNISVRALPRSGAGSPLATFNDPVRIGHALMTPGLADAMYEAIRRLFQFKPKVAQVELRMNLADPAQTRVVETGVHAPLAAAPAAIRQAVAISKCEAPGAEFAARFELYASPMQLNGIYSDLKRSRAVREFQRRLKRKIKPSKKAPKEVHAT